MICLRQTEPVNKKLSYPTRHVAIMDRQRLDLEQNIERNYHSLKNHTTMITFLMECICLLIEIQQRHISHMTNLILIKLLFSKVVLTDCEPTNILFSRWGYVICYNFLRNLAWAKWYFPLYLWKFGSFLNNPFETAWSSLMSKGWIIISKMSRHGTLVEWILIYILKSFWRFCAIVMAQKTVELPCVY